MQTSVRESKPELARGKKKIAGVFSLAVLICVLQGCGGSSSSSNFAASTTNNPAPGISLQAIKITPTTSLISLAENRQLFATGVYSDGSTADLTSQVTWSAASAPSTTSNVAISSKGIAKGTSIGLSVITASLGSVTGVLQLLVDTNGYTSGTIGILSVPYKGSVVDAAYLAQSATKTQGVYAVQEVNLDADSFSNVLPVPVALLASIPMPSGFVPNATMANQSQALVAVISYSSANIQVIDASNLSTDVASNTVVSTFTAPVTQSVTINGTSCMICAAVVNPLTGQLVLSTAQGFYSMDMVAGTFTATPFSPAPAPSANFSINPNGTSPYILSASSSAGEIQVLDLTTNAVTTIPSGSPTGLAAPVSAPIDLLIDYAAVVDGNTTDQSLIDLSNPLAPQFTVSDLGVGTCPGSTSLDMAAIGATPTPVEANSVQSLLLSQTSGGCVGLELLTNQLFTGLLPASLILYAYGPMPATPDGASFTNSSDPNAIATFNDVLSGSHANYGLLVDQGQQWMGRISLSAVLANSAYANNSAFLPAGAPFQSPGLCTAGQNLCATPGPVLYLPTPSTAVTLSLANINFGTVAVGTQTPAINVVEANIGTLELNNQIAVTGANAGDFTLLSSCDITILPRTTCTIGVSFTPSTASPESATLAVTVSGQTNPLQVALMGNSPSM